MIVNRPEKETVKVLNGWRTSIGRIWLSIPLIFLVKGGVVYLQYFMDMETLGTRDDAIILTIGTLMVPDDYTNDNPAEVYSEFGKLYHLNPLEEEKLYNRSIDFSTVHWWVTKNSEVFKEQINYETSWKMSRVIDEILSKLNRSGFFEKGTKNIMWSRGLFEVKLWDSVIRNLRYKESLMFWHWRDSRTACDVLCGDPNGNIKELSGLNKHDPVSDCVLDYFRLKKLGCLRGVIKY